MPMHNGHVDDSELMNEMAFINWCKYQAVVQNLAPLSAINFQARQRYNFKTFGVMFSVVKIIFWA